MIDAAAVSLAEAEDFTDFYIQAEGQSAEAVAERLGSLASPAGGGEFWIDVDVLADLAGRVDDRHWRERLQAMMRKVEPMGWADLSRGRIKAHVRGH